MQLTHIRQLDVTDTLASGNAWLSAASGLVRLGETLCVVADDEHHLALFTRNDANPGRLLQMIPGELPRKKKKRKAVKPDFEILFQLPKENGVENDLLYAMGSGSTAKRMRGACTDIGTGEVKLFDLQPLFAALAEWVGEVNLEGAAVRNNRLLLFNRGNMTHPETCILETPLCSATGGAISEVMLVKRLVFTAINGVPLNVTDVCLLDDGRFLLSAVAEGTDDSYADGALLGSAIILLDADFDVIAIETPKPALKIEGISARCVTDGIEFLCVTDADDPDTPSSLYSALWRI